MSRWIVLGILFFARAGMGFQYQTIASSMGFLRTGLGLTIDQIGMLIGAYFALGVVVALLSGAVGAHVGARRSVLLGLLLMAAGGACSAHAGGFAGQLAARMLAGAGGVLLNVMMSSMVGELFVAGGLATAMGVFVASWTFGVGVALVAIPRVEAASGYGLACMIGVAWSLAGFLAVLACGAPPRRPALATPRMRIAVSRETVGVSVLAGLVWGAFNAGFATIFGFGPAAMAEAGYSAASAGFLVSATLWTSMLSVPLGGLLADRTGRPGLLIALCPAVAACFMLASSCALAPMASFALLGLVIGIPAGPIMALAAQRLRPEDRAFGMGVFFTVFYIVMIAAPAVDGLVAAFSGSARAGYQAGIGWLVSGMCAHAVLVRQGRRAASTRAALEAA